MTPDQALASHRNMINSIGEGVTVRRYTDAASDPPAFTDTTAMARVMGYQPRDLVDGVQEGDVKVVMLVDALGGLLPLTNADKLVIRGRELAIRSVDDNTRRIAGVLIALEIHAAG